jgi:hypothetical protein
MIRREELETQCIDESVDDICLEVLEGLVGSTGHDEERIRRDARLSYS